jgi:hypothetical protein
MSRFVLSQIDESLARRLSDVDGDWLEERLEAACNDWESRKGGAELARYDAKSEIREDDSISPEEARRRELKWDRLVGGMRR